MFEQEQVLDKLAAKIALLTERLRADIASLRYVADIRQWGVMIGIELMRDPERKVPYEATAKIGIRVTKEARRRGVIIRPLGNVIVLMPPLSISTEELLLLLDVACLHGRRHRSPMRGILITGTDTGVGKTFVGCGLGAALTARGVTVGVLKPVETGCTVRDGTLYPEDAMRLAAFARSPLTLDQICPYRFAPPVAPHVAAELAGRTIEPRRIAMAFEQIAKVMM